MSEMVLSNKTDGAVDKTGVATVRAVYNTEDLITAMFGDPGQLVANTVLIDRQWNQRPDGGFEAILNYEGLVDPKRAAEWYELEGSTGEEPIESHPDIERLMDIYSGVENDGRVTFPPTISDSTGTTIRNELFGASVYYVPSLIWTKTWVATQFPQSIVRALGCIDTPPGIPGRQPPTLSGKRNWLKARANGRWRGNIWQITESWMLSDDGGWNKDVYRQT